MRVGAGQRAHISGYYVDGKSAIVFVYGVGYLEETACKGLPDVLTDKAHLRDVAQRFRPEGYAERKIQVRIRIVGVVAAGIHHVRREYEFLVPLDGYCDGGGAIGDRAGCRSLIELIAQTTIQRGVALGCFFNGLNKCAKIDKAAAAAAGVALAAAAAGKAAAAAAAVQTIAPVDPAASAGAVSKTAGDEVIIPRTAGSAGEIAGASLSGMGNCAAFREQRQITAAAAGPYRIAAVTGRRFSAVASGAGIAVTGIAIAGSINSCICIEAVPALIAAVIPRMITAAAAAGHQEYGPALVVNIQRRPRLSFTA